MPAVWWTTAYRTEAAYCGAPTRIDSSAPQPLRVTIGGATATAGARNGTLTTGLRTKYARSAVTRPVVR